MNCKKWGDRDLYIYFYPNGRLHFSYYRLIEDTNGYVYYDVSVVNIPNEDVISLKNKKIEEIAKYIIKKNQKFSNAPTKIFNKLKKFLNNERIQKNI